MISADRLPTLVSSLVLAVRVQAIPLLVHTVQNHQDPKTRDKLLELLFTLHKRPEKETRHCILAGIQYLSRQVSRVPCPNFGHPA